MSSDTKTIDQFLAENPDVDVSQAWEQCWGVLSDIKGRIAQRFQNKSESKPKLMMWNKN